MRVKGILTKWLDNKGFGFITPNAGGKEVFVHIKSFVTKGQRPEQGCVLTYELVKDKQGRFTASNVTHQGERLNKEPNASHRAATKQSARRSAQGSQSFITFTVLFSLVFIVGLFALVIFASLSFHFLSGYVLLSLLTFICYGMDKRAAQKGTWRMRESNLQLLALIGGWPGAIFAQQLLRHKSQKLSFRVQLWLMIIINVATFTWFFVPGSQAAIIQASAMLY